MDPGDSDEPSREELESRVAELEQTVSKMLPDRRGVLKGLGAAAVGGAAVGGATGGASGQSAAGQIGTPDDRVDVYANNYDAAGETVFDSVSVKDITIDTQDSGGNTLSTSRSSSKRSLTVQPFSIELFPSPGNQRAHYLVCNAGDFDNFGFIKFEVDGTQGLFRAAAKGTGTAPTSLLFDPTFTDGIRFESPTTIAPAKGDLSAPRTHILTRSVKDHQQSGLQSAGGSVTADNTQQVIFSPTDPPLSGLSVIVGLNKNAFDETFVDLVVNSRNNFVSAVSKNGSSAAPNRTYDIDGTDVTVQMDGGGSEFEVSVSHLGGGT